jgi:hypothetical protein
MLKARAGGRGLRLVRRANERWTYPKRRSEGGEDGSNINNLPRWAKREVHFAPIGAFQVQYRSLLP